MKGSKRKAITIVEEFDALTFLKPFSSEYDNYLIVNHEDAHGEFSGRLELITEIREKFNGTDEEFEKILKNLGK